MMFKLLFSLIQVIAGHKSGNSTANFHFTAKTSMPKQRKRTQGDLPTSTKTAEDDSPVQTNANSNTVTIKIIAKPGAKHNSVTDISSEGVGIQIAAPPVDGEANAELIRYLSHIFGLRKSDISVDKVPDNGEVLVKFMHDLGGFCTWPATDNVSWVSMDQLMEEIGHPNITG